MACYEKWSTLRTQKLIGISDMKNFTFAFILFLSFTQAYANESVICRDLRVSYDIERLEEELKLVENYYMPRSLGRDYWVAIPLRNPTGTETQEGLDLRKSLKKNTMLPCKNTIFLEQLPYISSILDDLAQKFNTEIGLVRISKVLSQNAIKPHQDGSMFDIHQRSIYRLHIPIVTGEDVIFEIDGKSYHLEPGTLYYTNVSKTHSVINNGLFDRIHIIIDVHASNELYEHILQSPELECEL